MARFDSWGRGGLKERLQRIPRAALVGAVLLVLVCGVLIALWAYTSYAHPAFEVVATDDAHLKEEGESEAPEQELSLADQESGSAEAQVNEGREDAQAASAATCTVHVAGAVKTPGVYTLAANARVQDAVTAAGGLSGDASGNAVNLARILADGEQIYIPTADEVSQAQASGGAALWEQPSDAVSGQGDSSGAASALVNINTADADELDTLPGVGPSTAAAIISEREENGAFASIEDIQRVSGIGEKKYAKIKDLICV